MTLKDENVRSYLIGNAKRPDVGEQILVPLTGNIHRAEVIDVSQDRVLVRVGVLVKRNAYRVIVPREVGQ